MSNLDNLTPFAAAMLPAMTRHDEALVLVVVSGRFELPRAGEVHPGEPTVARAQGEVRLADEYAGAPPAQLLRHEGQGTYTRPATDLYLHGHAWTRGGKPVARGSIALVVGACQRTAEVFGDRVWERSLRGVVPSAAQPFTCLPLSYARCFGGVTSDHNPAGCGLHDGASEATGRPLPNFEDPRALLRGVSDRPLPRGFGPVARHWSPRRAYAGTYDQAWLDRRIPLWPRDLDERFFCAAAPGLSVAPHLQGGERVQIVGMSPAGDHRFALPRVHLEVRFDLGSVSTRRHMLLDAISFDTDDGSFTMTWRTALVEDPLAVISAVVRRLAPSEIAR